MSLPASQSSVACVVIAFNSEGVVDACLKACQRQLEAIEGSEIVVVDNASTDRTVSVATGQSGVRVIPNPDNRGFAAAANQGIAACGADCVLLLNPDVELIDPIGPLIEACR